MGRSLLGAVRLGLLGRRLAAQRVAGEELGRLQLAVLVQPRLDVLHDVRVVLLLQHAATLRDGRLQRLLVPLRRAEGRGGALALRQAGPVRLHARAPLSHGRQDVGGGDEAGGGGWRRVEAGGAGRLAGRRRRRRPLGRKGGGRGVGGEGRGRRGRRGVRRGRRGGRGLRRGRRRRRRRVVGRRGVVVDDVYAVAPLLLHQDNAAGQSRRRRLRHAQVPADDAGAAAVVAVAVVAVAGAGLADVGLHGAAPRPAGAGGGGGGRGFAQPHRLQLRGPERPARRGRDVRLRREAFLARRGTPSSAGPLLAYGDDRHGGAVVVLVLVVVVSDGDGGGRGHGGGREVTRRRRRGAAVGGGGHAASGRHGADGGQAGGVGGGLPLSRVVAAVRVVVGLGLVELPVRRRPLGVAHAGLAAVHVGRHQQHGVGVLLDERLRRLVHAVLGEGDGGGLVVVMVRREGVRAAAAAVLPVLQFGLLQRLRHHAGVVRQLRAGAGSEARLVHRLALAGRDLLRHVGVDGGLGGGGPRVDAHDLPLGRGVRRPPLGQGGSEGHVGAVAVRLVLRQVADEARLLEDGYAGHRRDVGGVRPAPRGGHHLVVGPAPAPFRPRPDVHRAAVGAEVHVGQVRGALGALHPAAALLVVLLDPHLCRAQLGRRARAGLAGGILGRDWRWWIRGLVGLHHADHRHPLHGVGGSHGGHLLVARGRRGPRRVQAVQGVAAGRGRLVELGDRLVQFLCTKQKQKKLYKN